MKKWIAILLIAFMGVVWPISDALAPPQPQSVRIKDRVVNSFANVLRTAATLASNIFGLVVDATSYYFSDGNWHRWSGDTLNTDNIGVTVRVPRVGSFLHYLVAGVWRRISGRSAADDINPAQQGVDTIAYAHFLNATGPAFQRWTGIQSAAAAPGLPIAPWTLDIPYFYNVDGTQLAWWSGGVLDDDAVVTTSIAPYVGSFGHTYNTVGDVWSRISSYAATDNLTLPTAPFCISVTTLFDGAQLDLARASATGDLNVIDTSTRPGEDAGNDRRKYFKDDTNVYNPPVTTGTAVANNVPEIVCPSVYMLNTPNWSVWVKNAGGGAADVLTDVDVQVSYNNSDFSSHTSSTCDTLTTGTSARCYVASNESIGWVRTYANVAGGDDTTVDCRIQGNKN